MNDTPTNPVPPPAPAPPPPSVTIDQNNLVGLPTPTTLPPARETSVQTTQAPSVKPPSPPQIPATTTSVAAKPVTTTIEQPKIQGKSTDPLQFANLLKQIQNNFQNTQISGMQNMSAVTQLQTISSAVTPMGSGLQQNEQLLKQILQKSNNASQQAEINKSLQSLQPIFANIGDVLSFQAKELQENKDFYNQHYTVSPTQSAFNMTANQISDMPSWRK